jgi:hypothetical protein
LLGIFGKLNFNIRVEVVERSADRAGELMVVVKKRAPDAFVVERMRAGGDEESLTDCDGKETWQKEGMRTVNYIVEI